MISPVTRLVSYTILFLLGAGGMGGVSVAAAPTTTELSFYAATSLRDAMQALAPDCEKALGVRLVFNFGASNELARQIEAAGKADVFFSADEEWMNWLDERGLVDRSSRRDLLSNRLVVVAPTDTTLSVRSAADLAGPAIRRLSLANPEAVPVGKYAKAWLKRTGQWDRVESRVVPGFDARAALAAVESGAVDAGVVYKTDAALSRRIKVLYEVPEAESPDISYVAAALSDSEHLAIARRVVIWLAGAEAARAYERFGFIR